MQAAQSKASNLEKLKNRLNGEVEDLTSNLENVSAGFSYFVIWMKICSFSSLDPALMMFCLILLKPDKNCKFVRFCAILLLNLLSI